MNRFYVAYGSNLNTEQMHRRCPDAREYCSGVLKDFRLTFRYHANIEESPGSEVPVGLWLITPKDEWSLDRYEGFPRYYIKKTVKVDVDGMGLIPAMAYVMRDTTDKNPIAVPSLPYYNIIEQGYKDFGLALKPLQTAVEESMEV